MTSDEDFLREIMLEPHRALETLAVYADWLEEHGHNKDAKLMRASYDFAITSCSQVRKSGLVFEQLTECKILITPRQNEIAHIVAVNTPAVMWTHPDRIYAASDDEDGIFFFAWRVRRTFDFNPEK